MSTRVRIALIRKGPGTMQVSMDVNHLEVLISPVSQSVII